MAFVIVRTMFFTKTGLTDAWKNCYTHSNVQRKGAASHDVRSMEQNERHDDVRGYVHVHVLCFVMRSPPCIVFGKWCKEGVRIGTPSFFFFLWNGRQRKDETLP